MRLRLGLALFAACALSACAELRADKPLFTVADQVGPQPLAEGVWIAVNDDCPEKNAKRGRVPYDCWPIEITRQADGSWLARTREDLVIRSTIPRDREKSGVDRAAFVLVPAAESSSTTALAPLYLVELRDAEKGGATYAAIAPIGDAPAEAALILPAVWCNDALRDGPIDGVVSQESTPRAAGGPLREPTGRIESCKATSRAGAREAVRRAVIQSIPDLPSYRLVRLKAGKSTGTGSRR
jgi:hypothetical protein